MRADGNDDSGLGGHSNAMAAIDTPTPLLLLYTSRPCGPHVIFRIVLPYTPLLCFSLYFSVAQEICVALSE